MRPLKVWYVFLGCLSGKEERQLKVGQAARSPNGVEEDEERRGCGVAPSLWPLYSQSAVSSLFCFYVVVVDVHTQGRRDAMKA